MVATSEGMIQPSAVLDAYFDEAAAQFAAARSNAGAGPDRDFQLAGQTLALRFAGPALAGRILPAFGHHPPGDRPGPALSVLLWDSASTGTMLPPPPWGALDYHERGNMRAHDSERYSLSFDRPTDVFVAVDLKRRLGLFWTRDARQLPSFDTAAPLRRLLQGWLRSRQQFVVHAAAIGLADGGLLLAGRGGSGKSTTAVRALFYDLQYAGDDFCLVQSEPTPRVHSLFNAAKLNRDVFERMPEFDTAVVNRDRLWREKALIFVQEIFPERLISTFPLLAIVMPRVAGTPASTLTAASPLQAYSAIGPDTVLRTLGDPRGTLTMLKALVHRLPCYDLALGTDERGIRDALHEVLQRSHG
jgi:hypothetical protein